MNHVEVHQITSISGSKNQAYLNVDTTFGSVGVTTGSHDHPVILARHKINTSIVSMIVFDSEEFFREWVEQNTSFTFRRLKHDG